MTAVAARGITVSLGGVSVLDHVDLDVGTGCWVTVVGPNGAGKTTLLRAVAGTVDHDGDVYLDGRPAAAVGRRARARLVAMVPQTPVIPAGMTVGNYVLLGRTPHIRAFGVEGPEDRAVVADVLAQMELVHMAGRRIDTLSGGERQRAVLARALAQQASVLLLDEPSSSLDIAHQQDVLDAVDELRTTRQLTVVSTMHDLTLAGQYAEEIVLLADGRVVASGAPAAVLTEDNLARHYGARVKVLREPDGTIVVIPRRGIPKLTLNEVTT